MFHHIVVNKSHVSVLQPGLLSAYYLSIQLISVVTENCMLAEQPLISCTYLSYLLFRVFCCNKLCIIDVIIVIFTVLVNPLAHFSRNHFQYRTTSKSKCVSTFFLYLHPSSIVLLLCILILYIFFCVIIGQISFFMPYQIAPTEEQGWVAELMHEILTLILLLHE